MKVIRNFAEANAALLPYVPLVARLTGKDTTLERIRPLMKLLGNPQDKLKVVHIAGTSGKTSTAYFIAGLLHAAGKHVGLTVSPHVDSIAERVQLDGVPLDEQRFCDELGLFLTLVEQTEQKPSYFELLYAFSLWVFEREGVDYAVVETGMGGLHDATNIINRADKLCIITDIGLDHVHILGDTVEKIAAQKAGIIHHHNPVIMYRQSASVTAVVQDWSAAHDAQLMLTNEADELKAFTKPFAQNLVEYQCRNWLLAYRAFRFLQQRDALASLTDAQLVRTQDVQVPARMDRRIVDGKTIIMDGAHNEQKMTAFLASFRHAYPKAKPAVLLALKQGKDIEAVGPLIAGLASRLIVTTFDTTQDLPAKSADPEEIVRRFRAAGVNDMQVIRDQREAYRALLSGSEDICIITGSFYLLSQLRAGENIT